MLKTGFDVTTKEQLKQIAKSRLEFKCQKHPRYNPAHGGGAIMGNCGGCVEALDAYESMMNFRSALARFVTKARKYDKAKPRTRAKKPVGTSPALDSALGTLLQM